MQSTTNALDRLWARLDATTDFLMELPEGQRSKSHLATKARAIAQCISEFYGGNMDYVRETAMSRRAIRARDSEPT